MKTNLADSSWTCVSFSSSPLLQAEWARSGREAGARLAPWEFFYGVGKGEDQGDFSPPFRLFTRTGWHPSHPRSSVHHATGSSSTASPRDDRAEDRGGVPGGDAAAEAEAPPSVSAAESPAASRAAPPAAAESPAASLPASLARA